MNTLRDECIQRRLHRNLITLIRKVIDGAEQVPCVVGAANEADAEFGIWPGFAIVEIDFDDDRFAFVFKRQRAWPAVDVRGLWRRDVHLVPPAVAADQAGRAVAISRRSRLRAEHLARSERHVIVVATRCVLEPVRVRFIGGALGAEDAVRRRQADGATCQALSYSGNALAEFEVVVTDP